MESSKKNVIVRRSDTFPKPLTVKKGDYSFTPYCKTGILLNTFSTDMKASVGHLSELKPGQRGKIVSFTDYELSLKLMEMGCLPGEEVEVIRTAPFGDPIAYSVAGYVLSLRKSEAETVLISLSDLDV